MKDMSKFRQNAFLSMISFGSDKYVLAKGRYKVTKNVYRTHVYPSFDFGLKTTLKLLSFYSVFVVEWY
jgi:hypothetical protein